MPSFNSKSELHLNAVNPGSSLGVKHGNFAFTKTNQLLPFNKYMMQNGGVPVTLVKWRRSQSHQSKPLVSVVGDGLDAAVVHSNPFVRISEGDVERKVVRKSIVVGVIEIELG